MKLITWNCNMAFRKKWSFIQNEKADIVIIQECENEERLSLKKLLPECTSSIWIGENLNKGVGVFAFHDYRLKVSKKYKKQFKYVIPIRITGPASYTLFAIWAMPDKINKSNSYVGQVWNAINYYKSLLNERTILAGDFNSNQIWDHTRKQGHHMDVVNFLAEKNIYSLYHKRRKEAHGQEKEPTLYLLKKESKPYHMDYCFLSQNLIRRNTSIEVSKYKNCISYSDHMTLVINKIKD